MRHLQEQVKKAFCYQKLFWSFTVWINCSSDLKKFANSQPLASNFKSFSRSLDNFFFTVGQNYFGNKIPSIATTFLRLNKKWIFHNYSIELSYFGHYTLVAKLLKWNYSSTKASPFQNFFLLNIEHFNQQAQIERKKPDIPNGHYAIE